MPKGYGSFLALAALLSVQAVSAAPLDEGALRLYGGTYSAKCGDRGYQHLRVLPEYVGILRGDKQIATKNVDAQLSYFGRSPPPDFQVALIASVKPELEFTFLIYKDKRGRYIEIDGSPKMLQLLGQKSGDKTRYYECVKIASATPDSSGTAAPQWKKIDGGSDREIYIDPATVQRTGNLVKLVYLRDNKGKESERGNRFTVSIVWESEMDCSRRRGRDLRITGYGRPMGSGPGKEAPFAKNWREIGDPDEDIAGVAFNFVCPKK